MCFAKCQVKVGVDCIMVESRESSIFSKKQKEYEISEGKVLSISEPNEDTGVVSISVEYGDCDEVTSTMPQANVVSLTHLERKILFTEGYY